MPLHDWSELTGWDGFHLYWIAELARWLKPRLPAGYRVYAGTTPTLAVSAPSRDRPDLGVREVIPPPKSTNGTGETNAFEQTGWEPDQEISVATLATDHALFIERQDRLITAIELVSPRNKDRLSAQQGYTSIYAGYLIRGVNLLLVDVHPRPGGFSFADRIATELGMEQPPGPAPFAVAYRVGEESPEGGRYLALWRRALAVSLPLPLLPLPLSVHESVPVDLEATYHQAAGTAYLDEPNSS